MVSQQGLLWKFKGSTAPFTALTSLTLPCQVKVAREALKEKLGLSESTAIDFVLYLEGTPEEVVSDYFMLQPNSKVYARRCMASEASTLISAANSQFLEQHPEELEKIEREEEKDEEAEQVENEGQEEDEEEEDEDSKISSIIQEQNFYDSVDQESLSRRYYRNRMLLVGQGAPSVPGTQPSVSTTQSESAAVPQPGVQVTQNEYGDAVLEIIKVDADYICHMCGEKGHHIRNCVQPEGKRLSKKIRSATGIPTDFLTPISPDDISKYDEVYILKDGSFAIMREIESVSGGAFFTKTVDQRIQTQLGISQEESQNMSKGFKCTVCMCYFNNPVTTLCCGETFCLDCIIGKQNNSMDFGKNITCPTCKKSIKMTDLQSNTSLKKAVQSLILGNIDVLKNAKVSASSTSEKRKQPESDQTPKSAAKKSSIDPSILQKQKNLAANYIAQYLKK
ncbi:hypothetical protein BEWA_020730 [Theileria equi strain WA]|uniref:CCHC-type domain-containing protein n=1 Tax=Theileria equi strain WA TaxID=1537102 RepID=L0AW16_THEEQ|nr:hypothetical protein BEWA_020730 [Theileria equi strain WA]AFZ79226.1 hypothetical protein BEWA_020730 [Theileria equi strain WA]|eukprot:XP_004828892.1 hypothetical protein BEWA_020730 [Theileria equi strain WA]